MIKRYGLFGCWTRLCSGRELTCFIALCLLALMLAACSSRDRDSRAPEPPPQASELPPNGAFEMKLRNVVTDMRQALGDEYGPIDVSHYKLPVDTDWTAVTAYYEAEFGEGWLADDRIAGQRSGYRLRVWRYGDGRGLLAVGFIGMPNSGMQPRFHVLLVAVPRRD